MDAKQFGEGLTSGHLVMERCARALHDPATSIPMAFRSVGNGLTARRPPPKGRRWANGTWPCQRIEALALEHPLRDRLALPQAALTNEEVAP